MPAAPKTETDGRPPSRRARGRLGARAGTPNHAVPVRSAALESCRCVQRGERRRHGTGWGPCASTVQVRRPIRLGLTENSTIGKLGRQPDDVGAPALAWDGRGGGGAGVFGPPGPTRRRRPLRGTLLATSSPPKFLAIGLNYATHQRDGHGQPVPHFSTAVDRITVRAGAGVGVVGGNSAEGSGRGLRGRVGGVIGQRCRQSRRRRPLRVAGYLESTTSACATQKSSPHDARQGSTPWPWPGLTQTGADPHGCAADLGSTASDEDARQPADTLTGSRSRAARWHARAGRHHRTAPAGSAWPRPQV